MVYFSASPWRETMRSMRDQFSARLEVMQLEDRSDCSLRQTSHGQKSLDQRTQEYPDWREQVPTPALPLGQGTCLSTSGLPTASLPSEQRIGPACFSWFLSRARH